jgi:polyribonucleotide nucleotidyltransferase
MDLKTQELKAHSVEIDLDGTTLKMETGQMARQSDGAVVVRLGDTVVLVTAVSAHEAKEGQSFFPLTVNYEEKYYSAGKIPGGFFKREGRAGVEATLSARLIDRQIRPMFPEGYKNETQVIATILAYDGINEPDIPAAIGTGAALHVSDIPFEQPTASVRVGLIDDKFILNPSPEQLIESKLDLVLAGTVDAVNMVEGGAEFIPEGKLLDAIEYGHGWIKKILETTDQLRSQAGKEKRVFEAPKPTEGLFEKIEKGFVGKAREALSIRSKQERTAALDTLKEEVVASMVEGISDEDEKGSVEEETKDLWKELLSQEVRKMVLSDQIRIDGRAPNEVRAINTQANLLPVVHGSSLFTRGETQVMSVVTLGSKVDEQLIDSLAGTSYKSYMLHYNFPPFCTGEAKMLRGQSRREIGHGKLAERAIRPILPKSEDFPYTIRVVCEVLESNGSSSMGSVCSASMALMDAGIPTKTAVAGIAMGLIKEGDDVAVLSDILGDEDHLGDMDFKVTGNEEGVTAIQMDLKIRGITRDVMEKALDQAKEGRLAILKKMNEAIEASRTELRPSAPRIESLEIPKDKIRDVIGSGGKTIRHLSEITGAKIDIDDDGKIQVAASNAEGMDKAIEYIKGIAEGPQEGKTYHGLVKKIVDFGAFVEILPGVEGLLHISEIAHERIKNIKDHVEENQKIDVKVLEVDRVGRIRLSKRALLPKEEE